MLARALFLRLLFALLLMFGADILLWRDPITRDVSLWVVSAVGNLALAAVLLDLAQRYRARDVFGLLLLGGLHGLLSGVLLYPDWALADVPRTLLTRVLGAGGLVGFAMLTSGLALVRGQTRWGAWLLSAVVGVAWGVWARWSPAELGREAPTLSLVLVAGAAALLLIFAMRALVVRQPPVPDTLVLSPLGWIITGGALLVLLGFQVVQGALDATALFIIVLLALLCGVMLWFQKRVRRVTLLEVALAGAHPTLDWRALLAAVLLLMGGGVGYILSRGEGASDPLGLIGVVFLVFGVVWLPTVSLVIGGRGLMKQVRAEKI